MARKSSHEARVERMTWFAMVMTFLGASRFNVNGAYICIMLFIILLVSGLYQYRKGWKVGPLIFMFAGVALLLGLYGIFFTPMWDLSLIALLMVIVVIAVGVVTKES